MRMWIQKNFKNIIIFAGPILFEISDQITGDWWIAESNKLNISLGKFITALIGVMYFGVLSYITYKEAKEEKKVNSLEIEIESLKKKNGVYDDSAKSLGDILSYTTDKIKEQIRGFKKNKEIDMSFVNATNAATLVCERIYENIIELLGENKDITVNYYRKYSGEDGKTYSEMIAHEGYSTTPKYFRISRLLKIDDHSYYCERLLENDNPDIVFWETKESVAKAFRMPVEKCKYNQYIGIPIRRFASKEKVALIEVVAHNNTIMWDDIEEVKKFVKCYCKMFEEYFLLVDMLENLYGTINNSQMVQIGDGKYEQNSGL